MNQILNNINSFCIKFNNIMCQTLFCFYGFGLCLISLMANFVIEDGNIADSLVLIDFHKKFSNLEGLYQRSGGPKKIL